MYNILYLLLMTLITLFSNSITVSEISEQFRNLKQTTSTINDTDELSKEELPTTQDNGAPNNPTNSIIVEAANEPMIVDGIAQQVSSQSWSVNNDDATKVEMTTENKLIKGHEMQTVLIFDLCALSEIATAKSPIIGVRLN